MAAPLWYTLTMNRHPRDMTTTAAEGLPRRRFTVAELEQMTAAGILDEDDKCPNIPEDKDGFQDEDGCPEGNKNDRDGDGILDDVDKCPNDPETKNGFEDEDGCPDEVPEEVKEFTGVIEGIEFEFGKADIRDVSKSVLDRAIGILKEYDTIRLEISGHTDNVGTREQNLELSKDRAEAVKKYFVDHGIAEARLTTRGAGPDEPRDTNDTEDGRAKNRRTEFTISK